MDNGKPISETRNVDLPLAIECFEYYAGLADKIHGETIPVNGPYFNYTLREPELYKQAPPHLKGISAVQFIQTSDIVIHTLDDLQRAYINIFSCKDFDPEVARKFTEETFEGCTVNGNGKGIIICRM